MKNAEYRKEYDALEEEFAFAAEVAKARSRAGLSQAELARRMETTRDARSRGWKASAAVRRPAR
jgi:ribosome-binding protein aMBF1 (putative translation factor)